MRVLVTGATGFLGGYVVEALRARGHSVRALVRPGRPLRHLDGRDVECARGDLLDASSLARACRGVDGLVHCAVHPGFWSRQDDLQLRVNAGGTAELLRVAGAARLRRVVHVSTVATIGPTRDGAVLTEESSWQGVDMGMAYVRSKRLAERGALAEADRGLPLVVVNPGALVGPRMDGSPPAWHLQRLASGATRWVPRGGASFVDVADVAAGLVAALERGRVGERYLLTGHNMTWRQLGRAVARRAGRGHDFREIPDVVKRLLVTGSSVLDLLRLSRPPYTPQHFRQWGWFGFFDAAKARRELGYAVRPLVDSLERYAWRAE